MKLRPLLKRLTEADGPSGFEGRAAAVVRDAWLPYADEVEIDRLGSVIAYKRGTAAAEGDSAPRLLLAAHLDEIGLIVKDMVAFPDEDSGFGFLRVAVIGGIDVRQLYGQEVTVLASGEPAGDLIGIIGALPLSMLPQADKRKSYDLDALVVDTGLSYRELTGRVSVGDPISFHRPLSVLANNRVCGKSLDNRVSIAAVTECLKYLSRRQHAWDVVAVATVQEEETLLGAATSAYRLQPDIAIAIDVTFGKGPGVTDERGFELGAGPVLGWGPNVHPGVYRRLHEAASSLEMKVHIEPHGRGSGTDAMALQTVRAGIPTGLVTIPLRYMHSLVESVSLKDVKRAGRLVGQFAARLDGDTLTGLGNEFKGEDDA